MKQSLPASIFLTIEGIEGVGKSTAVKFIHDYLIKANKTFVVSREPGGTPLAEQIRKILLAPSPDETMLPETELLLMFASRVQHINNVILPALQSGKWVVCDRFIDASFAYQGGGRGVDVTHISLLENWLGGGLVPNVTLLLDAPPAVGLSRAKHRGPQDRIEQEKIEFFDRVRAGYLARAAKAPRRFRIIDASQPLDVVQAEMRKILDELLK